MNKETIKFLWEIYNDMVSQQIAQAGEDYPAYDIDSVIIKIKAKIDEELK
ncbi:MAG: hypothetical protein WC839_01770 [Candidatus Paceibacterota bacterium]